jgi:hypothetical protein
MKPMGWQNGCHLIRVCREKEAKSVIAEIEDRQFEAQFSVGDCFAGAGGWKKGCHGLILGCGNTAAQLSFIGYR